MQCDCVEAWDKRPFRRTLRVLEQDPGEQTLAGLERATGERPPGCPWRQLADPFVTAVIRAYRWHKTGELEARCGGSVPNALARGIEIYDAALNGVQSFDIRARREAEEQERKARQPPDRPPSGGSSRRRR
jgi:hypothetical protein